MNANNLYDFLSSYMEEFEYNQGTWHEIELKKIDKQEKTKLWNLFKDSYDYMKDDMIKGMSQKKFFNEYSKAFVLDGNGDKKMDAFIIYKEKNDYKKISLLGTNANGKKFLIEKLINILHKNGFFIEASLKIETILSKKLKPIQDINLIDKILGTFSNKKIVHKENGFYERNVSLSNKIITKRIYGNV